MALEVTPELSQPVEDVEYRYLWKINDEEFPWLTESSLSGDRIKRGDRVSVLVTPVFWGEPGIPVESREVVIPNGSPRITSTPPSFPGRGEYIYQVTAEDPEGDDLQYSLSQAPKGMEIDPKSGILTWQVGPDSTGEIKIQIRVEDGNGGWFTQNYSMKDE